MENLYDNLGIGIISGIISSLIVAFFIIVYQRIIEPYLRQLFYKNVTITGSWYCEFYITHNKEKKKKREFHLQINQKANLITGSLNIKNYNIIDKSDNWSYYKIKGEIINNFVRINYDTKDKNKIGIGQILFEIIGGGETLNGTIVCTELNSMKITSEESLIFNKIK